MSRLDDDTPLNRISIPGTHDSGSLHGEINTKCHSWDLDEQLDTGIRYLDIRCHPTGDSFAIHHGGAYQHLMFGDVLISVTTFLQNHPSETIIMRIKEEASDDKVRFEQIWNRYLETYGSWFHPAAATMPTIGEVRGKILVLDNTGVIYDGMDYDAQTIQDHWQLLTSPLIFEGQYDVPEPYGYKKFLIQEYIQKAQTDQNLVLNHLSGSLIPLGVKTVASNTNKFAYEYIGTCDKTSLGILIMDFPGFDLLYNIIKTNFDPPSGYTRCAYGNRVLIHSKNNCAGSMLRVFGEPIWGQSYRVDATQDPSVPNDEARSLRLNGPLWAGLRIILADDPNQLPSDDIAIITLENDIQWGESVCVPTFNKDESYFNGNAHARILFSGIPGGNGLDGKVSSVALYKPSNPAFSLSLGRTPKWSSSFSEEGDGLSDNNGYPIMGFYCSGNHCDNKKVLQPLNSPCRGTYLYDTPWFSEEDTNYRECGVNEYVGRIQCRGSKCDDMKLQCYSLNTVACQYSSHYFWRILDGESQWTADEFDIVQRVECYDDYCGKIHLGVKRVVPV